MTETKIHSLCCESPQSTTVIDLKASKRFDNKKNPNRLKRMFFKENKDMIKQSENFIENMVKDITISNFKGNIHRNWIA